MGVGGKIGVILIAKKPGRKKDFQGAKVFGEGRNFFRGGGNNSGCKKICRGVNEAEMGGCAKKRSSKIFREIE